MIAAVCLLFLVAGTMSQRSPYLSSDRDYPGVLNRFKPAASASSTTNSSGLGDRLGNNPPAAEQRPQSQGGAQGTIYDQEMINIVASWPEDKQPFWYKNRKQIAQHTGATVSQQNDSVSG